jgi:peptidoglycan-associated lipoprotein
MKPVSMRVLVLLAALAAAGLAAGCARKAQQAPPTPPPAPPTTPVPAPPTPPTPEPLPTPTPAPASQAAVQLEPAFFDFDSYALRDDARAALDRNAQTLRGQADLKITIEGHCDERGTVEYNQALGEKRAQAARDYLVAAGIDGGRIQILSYGKERPFASGHDESAWSQNRRAQLVVRASS